MGNISSYVEPLFGLPSIGQRLGLGTTKRNIEEVEKEDSSNFDSILKAPKRRKLWSTSQYIYKTLFEDGKESDVTVVALGQQWHLHKVYLCQSPYFSSMFSGNWKETYASVIEIEILDDNITTESLHVALGSFYRDDLNLDAASVIPLLATVVLLQMDSIIDQCTSIMKETINIQTVLNYHEAAMRYGAIEVEKSCKTWLLHNLLAQVTECSPTLRQISPNLMQELISSPHLYVMQTEFSVYVMLKAWAYLQINPIWSGSNDEAFYDAHNYFKNRKDDECFLEKEGKQFAHVFASLRLEYLMHHYLDVEMIQLDKILPPSWLQPAASQQWYNMLRIDQDKDIGPNNLSEDVFDKLCTRCGRVLVNSNHLWRWTGYNFGLDLVMTLDGSLLKLKRNHKTENLANAVLHSRRKVMYRVSVAGLNDQKQVIYTKSTGVQSVSLTKNEEIRVMVLDADVKYPLLLSANFLTVTPSTLPTLDTVEKPNKLDTGQKTDAETLQASIQHQPNYPPANISRNYSAV